MTQQSNIHTFGYLLYEIKRNNIQIPDFQRSHVWNMSQQKRWAENLRQQGLCPAFYLYRVDSGHVLQVADGAQRIYTTQLILERPTVFGFNDGDEVERLLSLWNIPVIQVTVNDEEEGYQLFVKLNALGTAPTLADTYKGEMICGKYSTNNSKWIYEEINGYLRERMSLIVRVKTSKTLLESSKEIRGNLSLFYQYITKNQGVHLWPVMSPPTHGQPIETLLAQYLHENPTIDVKNVMSDFLQYVSGIVQLIRAALDKHLSPGSTVTPGLLRHLLHFSVYCRNRGINSTLKNRYISEVIKYSENGGGRINIALPDGAINSQRLASDSLHTVDGACEILGIDLGEFKRKKNPITLVNGLEHSHINPVSTYGEGETFPEPAPLNRARGARSVDNDQASYFYGNAP